MKTKYILKNNIDGNHNNQKQKKIWNEDNIIELISNHYNVKARKERLFANKNEKSTKPSTDAKIVMTSGTLWKNLRKTDSSEFNTAYKNRDSSEKQNSKTSPYRSIKDKKCISQYTLKPKLKIVKGKDPNKIYWKKIENPFKKKLVGEFDVSSKHSNLSPHSRLKSGEISKDKKTKKKPNHKRLISSITNAKSQAILGRSQTGITEGNKSLKLLWDTLQQTYRQPLVVKNLFPKSTLFKNRESNSKNKKESSKGRNKIFSIILYNFLYIIYKILLFL